MKPLDLALNLAALAHFCILLASAMAPRVLDWRTHLRELPRMIRQLFWVYGLFIVVMIISFGTLTFVHRDAMLAGDPVARSLCILIAVFWGLRLAVQLFIFDAKPFLKSTWHRLGYHTLTATFIFLTTVYTAAAILT